jgi:hypothetical protein
MRGRGVRAASTAAIWEMRPADDRTMEKMALAAVMIFF